MGPSLKRWQRRHEPARQSTFQPARLIGPRLTAQKKLAMYVFKPATSRSCALFAAGTCRRPLGRVRPPIDLPSSGRCRPQLRSPIPDVYRPQTSVPDWPCPLPSHSRRQPVAGACGMHCRRAPRNTRVGLTCHTTPMRATFETLQLARLTRRSRRQRHQPPFQPLVCIQRSRPSTRRPE